ncbi:LytR/AlgR family response regulator transcription factor [Haliscomenobacter sp.]|uniref:LytR/AlgR family response regulator transcription factor n=1 Tax=Haliscomenobacter sp. TaxID=2717303 RepID=UPI003592F802
MLDKFKCLIVDDEPIARQIIEIYCGHLLDVAVVASCGNALEAKYVLQKEQIDLLFLDINMPVLDGISFLKTLRNPPEIIFTTAYKEYALDAFDLAACDYLLKPFSLERFIIAVDKAKERLRPVKTTIIHPAETPQEAYIFIKSDGKIFKILFEELLYAEASGNHIKLITEKNTIVSTMTFSTLEEQLPKTKFLRLHRSFIINKAKISHIEGNRVFIGAVQLPIGANYREAFLKEIGI